MKLNRLPIIVTTLLVATTGIADAQLLSIPDDTKFLEKYEASTPVVFVDDHPIILKDILIARQELPPQIQGIDDASLYEWLITQVTEQYLLADFAKKEKLDKSKIFQEKMAFLREATLAKFYLASIITPQITEERIKGYYDALKEHTAEQSEVRARHILVETEKAAKSILQDLKNGKDFAKLAEKHSKDTGSAKNGGDLGWFSFDRMTPPFAEASFSLNKNELSKPVKTNYGWHIIQLLDKRKMTVPDLNEEMKHNIVQQLAEQMTREVIDQIRKGATIKLSDAGIPSPEAVRMDSLVSE